ncbi:MAG: hypothetical protein IKC61_02630 [Clostridia bacterium]|nr:hypothetical protein [Clostridia bacterium]
MKTISFTTNVSERIENAIRNSMKTYLSRLDNGFYEIGLEDTFKMHIGSIISAELELSTICPGERFIVMFEKNMPINNNNDYVDIVIKYQASTTVELYPIELKFKKSTDLAPDLGNIQSYIDIYNLDAHKANTPNVKDCYYIFMTDYETYTKPASRGTTRQELPMNDGYKIQKNTPYTVSGKSAKDNTKKYPSGFTFHNDYCIEYETSSINGTPYWYYILKI